MFRLRFERFLVRRILPLVACVALSILILRPALLYAAEGYALVGGHPRIPAATDCEPRTIDGEIDDSCRRPIFATDWSMWLALGVGFGVFVAHQYWGLYRRRIED